MLISVVENGRTDKGLAFHSGAKNFAHNTFHSGSTMNSCVVYNAYPTDRYAHSRDLMNCAVGFAISREG